MTLTSFDQQVFGKLLEAFQPKPEVDVFGLLEYEPTARQQVFHDATEFDVLYGGAAGGGKTKCLVADDLRDAIRYPGIRIGAFRRTYGELKESLLAELAQFGFGQALGAKWNGTEYELRFPNGSLIMYRYAENMADATRRQGGQYQKLTFDERNLTSPDVIRFLESRLRSGRKDLPVIGIRSGTNPGGVGHSASRDRYIDPTEYGAKVVTDIRNRTVRFIPSKLSDNPHVNTEYAMDLMALDGPQRAAFLDGNWDAFAGAMFPELNRDRHVIDPIELPKSWKRYNGIDWGFTAPWAVMWAAVDEDGRVWIYREIYRKQVGEADQARQILEAEADGERVSVRFADDAMWATRGDAKPIADVYADNGVHLTKAGKGAGSRVHGWQRWHTYLAEAPACPHHRAQGWDTCPKVHIFSTCPETFKELRDLPHAIIGDPEDADSRAPDHLADAGRYLLTNLETASAVDLFPRLPWRVWSWAPDSGVGRAVSCAGRPWPLASMRVFVTAAPAADEADFTVASVWGRTVDGSLILLDRDRRCGGDPLDGARALVGAWKADTVYVTRRDHVQLLKAGYGAHRLHLNPLDVDPDLTTLALPASAAVIGGKVWLPAVADWREQWIAEHLSFPHSRQQGSVMTLALAVFATATRWIPPPQQPALPRPAVDDGPNFMTMNF